jgi:hypothetical protein
MPPEQWHVVGARLSSSEKAFQPKLFVNESALHESKV